GSQVNLGLRTATPEQFSAQALNLAPSIPLRSSSETPSLRISSFEKNRIQEGGFNVEGSIYDRMKVQALAPLEINSNPRHQYKNPRRLLDHAIAVTNDQYQY
ncbi:clathrin heavy chain, partial [Moniliophthora roreri]